MNFYCLDLNGELIWKYKTQGANYWEPVVWENNVYFGSYDCHLYVLDSKTGKLVWKFRTEGSPSKYPPPYEEYELSVPVPQPVVEEKRKKKYDINISEEEERKGAYKSRTTYQTDTTGYSARGKYQKDSDEEEF